MEFNWSVFVDLGIIGIALLVATFIRAKVRFFQRFLIPNALTAGFILLPLYNFVFPAIGHDAAGLGELAYHLLSISFVAMALRRAPRAEQRRDGRIFAMASAVIGQYAIQALIGLLLTAAMIATIFPDLFEPFGFMLPLGFALGPGQALSIGGGWESFGIEGAGSIGLTFAALGFIWCSIGGIFLINYGIRNGWVPQKLRETLMNQGIRTGIYPRHKRRPVGANLTTESEAIDSMTLNAAIALISYFGAYLFLLGINALFSRIGGPVAELGRNLWGISFIFASLMAMLIRGVFKLAKIDHLLDNGTLTRIAGFSVDVMVAAAIGAIELVVVAAFWAPILIVSLAGAAATTILVPWTASRMFIDHRFQRMLLVFGVSTGTLSTGLALLRVVDPHFETPVASDYTYASGLTFVFLIPFLLAINLPVRTFTTGNPIYFWAAVGIAAAYALFAFITYLLMARRRAFVGKNVWHKPARVA